MPFLKFSSLLAPGFPFSSLTIHKGKPHPPNAKRGAEWSHVNSQCRPDSNVHCAPWQLAYPGPITSLSPNATQILLPGIELLTEFKFLCNLGCLTTSLNLMHLLKLFLPNLSATRPRKGQWRFSCGFGSSLNGQ